MLHNLPVAERTGWMVHAIWLEGDLLRLCGTFRDKNPIGLEDNLSDANQLFYLSSYFCVSRCSSK